MPFEILLGETSLLRKITAFTENTASQNQVKHWSLLLMCSPQDFKITMIMIMIMIIIIIITVIVRVTVHSPGWPGTGSMKQASSPQSQEPCPLCLPGIKGMYHKVQLQIVFK